MSANLNTFFVYPTPHGPLTLQASQRGLMRITFGNERLEGRNVATTLTNDAATQLQEYLAGKRTDFDVPLDIQGSAFQKLVFAEVASIPYGQTRTPAEIAEAMGKPGSHRSVGTAIRHNELAPIIPTHRVSAPNATGKQARIFRALVAIEQRGSVR